MALEIPDFARTPCHDLTVCAHILDVDVALRRKLQRFEDEDLVVHVRNKHCFALIETGGRTGNHFHVDLFEEGAFDEPPEPTGSVKDFGNRFKIIEGHQVEAVSDATFVVAKEGLPPIVQQMMLAGQGGDVGMKVTGGRLSVDQANVSRITWWLNANESRASVRFESRGIKTADEMYLVNEFAALCAAFDAFIVGGVKA